MRNRIRFVVIVAVIAVIAVGSLAFAKKPVTPPPDDDVCSYPQCVKDILCPDIWNPVLCADGVVYSNLCYASIACAPEIGRAHV